MPLSVSTQLDLLSEFLLGILRDKICTHSLSCKSMIISYITLCKFFIN